MKESDGKKKGEKQLSCFFCLSSLTFVFFSFDFQLLVASLTDSTLYYIYLYYKSNTLFYFNHASLSNKPTSLRLTPPYLWPKQNTRYFYVFVYVPSGFSYSFKYYIYNCSYYFWIDIKKKLLLLTSYKKYGWFYWYFGITYIEWNSHIYPILGRILLLP